MIALVFVIVGIFIPSSSSEGCGMRPAFSRVVNGQDAARDSWPWQISLRVGGKHHCGGSLIRKDWVLTAAHCVYLNPKPSVYTVVVGAHSRLGTTSVQETFRVKQLYKHSGFTLENGKHDVAVLQLERPVRLSEKVNTICLPDQDAGLGLKCYITGWGRISGGGPAADILQQAKLPLVSHKDCKKQYRSINRRAHLCAGEGRASASGGCNGDSGGPLACEMGDRWYLHGAVSFGMRDCPTTHYTVFARITSYRSWILNKIDCGRRPPFSRVVNGQNATLHSWPWQISLRVGGGHICGGSLIREDWVLTAAHCVYRNPNPRIYTVVLGAHRRLGSTSEQQTLRVKKLYKHCGFTMENLKHDVAVLQLERPVQLSEKVNTICLPDQDADLDSKCYITGWGRISGGGPAADILQQAKLPLVSHKDCKKKYRGSISRSAHLCAGEGRASASGGCNGDSGGPLACEMGDRWYLHGAVSFGMRDCPTTHYTVFARITSYKSWILKKIG